MCRIFLVGFMGCGKTATGRCLAQEIGWQWYDTDKFIEQRYRKTISEVFEHFGEKKFRAIEHSIISELAEFEDIVVSCGGGLPCFLDNMEIMKNAGKTFYLQTTTEHLFETLKKTKNKRVLLKNKSENELQNFISETLKKRENFYKQADFTIKVAENFEHIAEILKNIY